MQAITNFYKKVQLKIIIKLFYYFLTLEQMYSNHFSKSMICQKLKTGHFLNSLLKINIRATRIQKKDWFKIKIVDQVK